MKNTVLFADGRRLEDVEIERNIFISPSEVTEDMLTEKALERVTITPEEGEEKVLRYAKTDIVYKVEDTWHFCLVGESPEQIRIRELEAALSALLSGEVE